MSVGQLSRTLIRKRWSAFCCFTLILIITGCDTDDPVPSNYVGNALLSADITIVSGADASVSAIAQFTTPSGAGTVYVDIVAGDTLLISNNGPVSDDSTFTNNIFGNSASYSDDVIVMEERTVIFNQPEYIAILNNTDQSQPFYVSMFRSVDDSILNSNVTLPNDFSITAPQSNVSISRMSDITLQWSNSGTADFMEYNIWGTCGVNDDVDITLTIPSDSGMHTITTADFISEIADTSTNCTLNIVLKRIRNGMLSNKFGLGGSIQGIEQRTVVFTSTP